MKINQSHAYKPSFCAIKIADTKNYINNIETPISVYFITQKDNVFLDKLGKSLKMRDLMSRLSENMCNIWQEIFKLSISQAQGKDKFTLMGFFKNKPCSVMNYTKEKNSYKINTICSWPVEPDKKVPYAGKTLFSVLFRDFLQNDFSHIDLDAITNGPFNAVGKYMSLGFKQRGGENYILAMRANKESVVKSLNSLDKIIRVKPSVCFDEVDLLGKIE